MPLNAPTSQSPATGLVDEGRSNSWLIDKNKFAVPNLLQLPYLEQIDKDEFLNNLANYANRTYPKGQTVQVARPEGMDDATYAILQKFADPFRPARIILEKQTSKPTTHVAVSSGGTHVLVVSDAIEIISLDNAHVKKHAIPVKRVIKAFLSADARHAVVIGEDEIVRFDVSTGEVIARWTAPSPLLGGDYTSSADRLVVCPRGRAVTVLDGELQLVRVVSQINSVRQIAINFGGTHFLPVNKYYSKIQAIASPDLSNITFGGSNGVPEEEEDETIGYGFAAFARQHGFVYRGKTLEMIEIGQSTGNEARVPTPLSLSAFEDDGRPIALAVFGMQVDGRKVYFARDYVPAQQERGAPVMLPPAKPNCIDVSADGSVIALGYQGSVAIIDRTVHPFSGHRGVMRNAYFLLIDGKIEQLDLFTRAVTAFPRTFDGCTGSELSCNIAQMLARSTSWYGNAENDELRDLTQQWWRMDNPCAKLHAVLHRFPLPDSSSFYYGNPDSVQTYLESMERRWPDSLELAYARYRQSIAQGQFNQAETQSLLAQMTTRYPMFFRPIADYLLHLNEAQDTRSLGRALPGKAATIYPPKMQDLVAGRFLVEGAIAASKTTLSNFPPGYRSGLEQLGSETVLDGLSEQIVRTYLASVLSDDQLDLISQTLVRRAIEAGGLEIYSDLY
ncbi:MAG TPA: hypothetical protein DDW52_25150 [Planctomycetaceae bacterium]|nr:hypothetical protein [Planctomycetaceae bacterium]